jgi:predicted outer membrane repeat protein
MRASRILITSIFSLVITMGVFWGIARANSEPAKPDSPSGKIIYVDADPVSGVRSGTSWDNAYQYLQTALSFANLGDQIWVAEGVYYPDEGPGQVANDRNSTFSLVNGVAIYGGFDPDSGIDTFGERDWQTYVTILSGDLYQNDTNIDGNYIAEDTDDIQGNNTYHVVSGAGMSETTILNGFTITAGQANGPNWFSRGGGMENFMSSPTLTNLVFSGNYAYEGGGVYNSNDSLPKFTDVTFSGNAATDGGGMYNILSSNPLLTKVTISSNEATDHGGGMYNDDSNPTLSDVNFDGNSSNYGGGMFNQNNSNPTLLDVTFSDNTAGLNGGGMRNYTNSNPSLTDVTFSGNSATNGGGMANAGSNPTLNDVTFSGNSATDGGGMHNNASNPSLISVTFSSNPATDQGGGLFNMADSNPSLTDVTFSENSAIYGGGIYNDESDPTLMDVTFSENDALYGGGMHNYTSSPTLTNVIFSGNQAPWYGGGINNSQSSPVLTNVVFSGNRAGVRGGGMNNFENCFPSLTNVTFSGNTASDGGGIYNQASNPALTNVILWDNTADNSGDNIYNNPGKPIIKFSDIQGSGGSGSGWDDALGEDWGDNIDINPLFVRDPDPGPDGVWNRVDDDYGDLHLQATSLAIDTGTNTGCPATDIDGIPRPVGSTCDMGAYEWFIAGVTLEPDRSSNVAPGGAVTYQHTLTNIGNISDTFTLVATSSQGWIVEVKPLTVTVSMDASTPIEVIINIPADATKKDVTTVTAMSNADSSVSDSVTDTTFAGFNIYLPLVSH